MTLLIMELLFKKNLQRKKSASLFFKFIFKALRIIFENLGVTRRGGVDHVSKIPKYQQEDVTDASSLTHCSKSSFFVQKFNFDFPKKLLIFLGEKLVKMLWLSTVKLLTTLISREKLSRKFCLKNSWKILWFWTF